MKIRIRNNSKYNGKFKIGEKLGCYELVDDKIYTMGEKTSGYLKCKCMFCETEKYNEIKLLLSKPSHCRNCSIYYNLEKYPIGMKFGNWTRISNKIEKISEGLTKKRIAFEVQCKCGVIKLIRADRLVHTLSESCHVCACNGGVGPISGGRISRMKENARSRNIIWNLTNQDLLDQWNKQIGKCALSGLDLKFHSKARVFDGNASLDRIDSKIGYTKDNIQWVHKDVNTTKMDFEQSYFINLCKLIGNKT